MERLKQLNSDISSEQPLSKYKQLQINWNEIEDNNNIPLIYLHKQPQIKTGKF